MPIERIYAHPSIRDDVGSVALQRGPLVYCLETADNAIPLDLIQLSPSTPLHSQFDATTLGGVTLLTGSAHAQTAADWGETLYRTTPPISQEHTLVAIPYYVWDNRQPGEMRVWIRERP